MIQPLLDRVVLEKLEIEKKTASGIVLSDVKEKPSIAKVLAVGPGKYENGNLIPVGISVGETVVYKQYATTEIKVDGKEYLIVESKDILAIVK